MRTDTDEALPPMCEPPRFFELLYELARTGHISGLGITGEALIQVRAALAQRQQVPADALLRLWPAIESAMRGIVFTAERAGEVQADMNAVRAALSAAPSAQAEPVAPAIPEGWVPLRIEWEPGYAEDVAFGPKRMMDRLKKWLDAHYATKLAAAQAQPQEPHRSAPLTEEQIDGLRGLDTASRVRFYEHDFYVLSNFSAFNLRWKGNTFPTSEHAYHWEKFEPGTKDEHGLYVRDRILTAESAHAAFKMAEAWKPLRRPDWDSVKVDIMRNILRKKARQHEYVLRKLLATGDRELVEDSWRDDFWGWGPNRDGKNMLGTLWMQVRAELRELDQ